MNSKYSCVTAMMKRLPLDLTQAIENKMVCGSVWNLKSQAELKSKLHDFTM